MLVDCGTCEVRGIACGDCVLTVLWGPPDAEAGPTLVDGTVGGAEVRSLDADERRALRVLSDAGLAPPLQHVPPVRRTG